MSFEGIIFLVLWVVVATIIIFGLFTKKGRSVSIEVQFGAKVIADKGVISEDSLLLGKQTVRLYECEKNNLRFYVMEVKRTAPLGFSYSYVRIDNDILKQLNEYLNSKPSIA